MAPRTIAIDDAVRQHSTEQLVILGAGLDARAWRMGELAGTIVFEVDHPATQLDKRERLGERTPVAKEVRLVATDFGQEGLGDALERAGHRTEVPTTWVWEGIVPYLTSMQVAATLAVVDMRSAPGSRLVVIYQVPSAKAGIGQLIGRLMMRLARSPDPWSEEPHRSHWTPDQLSALLEQHGFTTLRDHDLLQVSRALGLPRMQLRDPPIRAPAARRATWAQASGLPNVRGTLLTSGAPISVRDDHARLVAPPVTGRSHCGPHGILHRRGSADEAGPGGVTRVESTMWTPTARLTVLIFPSHARSGWKMEPNACVAGNSSANVPGPLRGEPVASLRFGFSPGRAFRRSLRRSLPPRRSAVRSWPGPSCSTAANLCCASPHQRTDPRTSSRSRALSPFDPRGVP